MPLQTAILHSPTRVACGFKRKTEVISKGKGIFWNWRSTEKRPKCCELPVGGAPCPHPRAAGPTACPAGSRVRLREARAAEAGRAPSSLRAPRAILIGCSYAGLSSSAPSECSLPLPFLKPSPHSAPPPAPDARLLFLAAEFGPGSRLGDSPATDAGRRDLHP